MATNDSVPRDIALETGEKHKKVSKLVQDKLSPFYKTTMKQVFMYALGIGLRNRKRTPLKKRTGAIPYTTFNDADLSIIKAIAIAEKGNVDILFGENKRKIFQIAEEYANGGIDLLYYQVFGDEPGDPDRKMEQYLIEILRAKDAKAHPKEKVVKSGSDLLRSLENELRKFIQESLGGVSGSNWWKQSIPQDVRKRCKERKLRRERLPWMDEKDYDPIYYADFSDYYKIITRRDNWRKIFKRYFIDEAWVKTKLLLELNPIRNDIAHNRRLDSERIEKLKSVSNEILRCIQR